jgi:eukaryotic-like serine/threonine-protein kinase
VEEALVDRIGPGTLLAGRYRLQEQVQADPVTALWRAEDLTLERPVGVRVLSAEHPRVQATLDSARRAALVDDPRLQRVLGVGVEAGSGYVVLEWVTGQDAGALAGKVSEQEAVRIVTEAAEALRTAASRSLHHGRIGPRQLVRASDGSVRVVGTAVDVAASGQATPAAAARPEARDVRDLGAVLFALVTGRWPFGFVEGLLAAPTDKGRPVPASQLRSDVTEPLDQLLGETLAGQGPQSLDELVQRLHLVRAAAANAAGPTAVAGGAAAQAGSDDREPDDTDVITPVTPAAAAAALAAGGTGAGAAGAGAAGAAGAGAAGAGAAGAAAGAGAGAAGAAAGAGAAAAGLAAGAAVGGSTPAAAPSSAGPTPQGPPSHPPGRDVGRTAAYGPPGPTGPTGGAAAPPAWQEPVEDDGWDLLPVGDDTWDGQVYDEAYGQGYQAGGDQGWYDEDQVQPWDEEPWQAQDDPAAAAAVLPGTARSPRRRPAGAGTGVAVVLIMGAFVVGGLVFALDRIQNPSEDVAAQPTPVVTETVAPSPEEPSEPEPSEEPSEETGPELISPVGVQALDPQGDGEENDQDAPRAIDGDPASAWSTQRYNSQPFGGLKTGLGLVFDLGSPRDVVSVRVTAPGAGGTYEIRTAGGPGFDGSTVVATGQTGDQPADVAPEAPVNTQYLIVWFTALPDNGGEWRGVVSEVQVQVQ